MSCTFVPPICCSASMRAAPHACLHPAGRRCRSMTACEPDGSRHRVTWPPHVCLAPKPGGAHCQLHGVAARGGRPSDGDPPVGDLAVDEALTHRGRCGTCSTASSAGGPLMAVAARCPSPSTMGVITTTRFGTVLSSSLAMGMGRSLIASPSRWMSWRTSSRTVSRSSPSDWLIRISQVPK